MFRIIGFLLLLPAFAGAQNSVGIFENHNDVGTVLHAGSATFDPATSSYTLRGGGENMWGSQDAFQFA